MLPRGLNVIRVIIADDHPVIRSSLRKILERTPDIAVIGEASNGQEAINLVEKECPDVLILDINMPQMDGLETTRHLRLKKTPVGILILSAYNSLHFIQSVLANGAAGYLLKEEAPHLIEAAVRGVARGEQGWLSEGIISQLGSSSAFPWIENFTGA